MAALDFRFADPSRSVDYWLDLVRQECQHSDQLVNPQDRWLIRDLCFESAELCLELETRSIEAGVPEKPGKAMQVEAAVGVKEGEPRQAQSLTESAAGPEPRDPGNPPDSRELARWHREGRRKRARDAALDLDKAAALAAEAELRKESANAVLQTWPPDSYELEQVLWTPLSKFAETVYDKIAEARLRELGAKFRVRHYAHWLECTCLPAVVDDVCRPMGKFYATGDHVFKVIGESDWPERVARTRRVVAGILTEVLGGPRTENLEKRLRAYLGARIGHWEAKAIEKKGPGRLRDTARLNIKLIRQWIDKEGYDNEGLANSLHISPRAVSSLRNNGGYHGDDAVTKLANLMGLDVEDLYLS
jgi:hypothetical protein